MSVFSTLPLQAGADDAAGLSGDGELPALARNQRKVGSWDLCEAEQPDCRPVPHPGPSR